MAKAGFLMTWLILHRMILRQYWWQNLVPDFGLGSRALVPSFIPSRHNRAHRDSTGGFGLLQCSVLVLLSSSSLCFTQFYAFWVRSHSESQQNLGRGLRSRKTRFRGALRNQFNRIPHQIERNLSIKDSFGYTTAHAESFHGRWPRGRWNR